MSETADEGRLWHRNEGRGSKRPKQGYHATIGKDFR